VSDRREDHEEDRLDRRAYFAPADADARVEASLAAIDRRLSPASRRRRRLAYGGTGAVLAAAAAAVLSWIAVRAPGAPPAWAGPVLETGVAQVAVALADGSRVESDAASEIALARSASDEVRLALRRGGATFDVARRPDRRFVVEVDGVEVSVIGTRFTVRRISDPHRAVEVAVERGRVEVRAGDEHRELGAGQRWRIDLEPPSRAQLGSAAESERAAPEIASSAAADRADEGADEGAIAPAIEGASPDRSSEDRAAPLGAEAPAARGRDEAASLFEGALAARHGGSLRGAEASLERLLAEHPRDARAPLAAFELGRLRMDALGDRQGAIRALERSLAIGRSSPFREDALARLVALHRALGQERACERRAREYLTRHPEGAHAGDVRRGCTTP
jgi:TolA-binding protein